MVKLKELFNNPKVISVIADVHQGKSMLLYDILEKLQLYSEYELYYYGLRIDIPKYKVRSTRIYSVAEMEAIRNSIIIIDELSSLFDLDNRKIKRQIENTMRLINHNNNILVLCGTPENFKKFISAKTDYVIYKKCTLSDFINGCSVKNILTRYKGYELGSEILNLRIDEALLFDGHHYEKFNVKYYAEYDSKKTNKDILRNKKRS